MTRLLTLTASISSALVLIGCGNKTEAPKAKDDAPAGPTAAPLAMPALGVDQIKRFNFIYEAGAPAHEKAVAAYRKKDWAAVRTQAEAALVKDPMHLGSHRLLAAALAQTGEPAAAVDHLVTALAADYGLYAPTLAEDDLKSFMASPHGQSVKALAARIHDEYARRTAAGLWLVGRRSPFRWPKELGVQTSTSRGELYAFDRVAKRYFRLTHTEHQVAGFVRPASGTEVAIVGFDKIDRPRPGAKDDVKPAAKDDARPGAKDDAAEAAPLFAAPAIRFDLPFDGFVIPGYLRLPPAASGRVPVVIVLGGLESTKEESYRFENLCLARGLATCTFDGPGQGETYFQAKLRPDFHRFTSAVLDWIEKRTEFDPDRIGIIGRSLGGFYAIHSAAHDPRFKACVCWGVLFDLSYYDQMRDPARRGFAFVAGYDDAEKAGPYLKSTLDLSGQAERVRCPVYALHGAQDVLIPATQVDRLRKAMAAHPDMTFDIPEDGNHCCHNLYAVVRPRMADWLAERLSART
jgi:2,6-dihydroxypseudooxynicotine hydrolase